MIKNQLKMNLKNIYERLLTVCGKTCGVTMEVLCSVCKGTQESLS